MSKTIQETIAELHGALTDYIEATYHISNSILINQRRALLEERGVTFQIPYLESTPRYTAGKRFNEIPGLPPAALEVYEALSSASNGLPRIIYNPPYSHQYESIRQSLVEGKNLIIMTGTGSGKTESFLLPILGKLAREAAANPKAFAQPATRALLLYPMNALVNDQLGRLRALFGDKRLVDKFNGWAGRPPRFARYTSRTPYAGVRTSKKDSVKLKSFDDFYVQIQQQADDTSSEGHATAKHLLDQLKSRGKWPAKPDLAAWYGDKGSNWKNRKTGEFARAVTLNDDSELLTRHEVQEATPDLLVTNYSMLEYMLMRPIERPIFNQTREWLAQNPKEKILVVLDEAHLYRGAAGAEVGLLLRRLRERLEIPPERFQVICATASFQDIDYAPEFGGQLAGVPAETFVPIVGTLDLKPQDSAGSAKDAELLAGIDLEAFYSPDEKTRLASIKPLLQARDTKGGDGLDRDLFNALSDYGPLKKMINITMKQAHPISKLGAELFPGANQRTADKAVTSLLALGSVAREDPMGAGLLPCRIHNFFRGLPGLWVCMDPACTELKDDERSGICGRMYSQPRNRCNCGACVMELYTCRSCGTAHARAYTDNIDNPNALWAESGRWMRMPDGTISPNLPLDLLLEEPQEEGVAEPADFDLETGRLNPPQLGERTRTVYIRRERIAPVATDDDEQEDNTNTDVLGQFVPCAVCGQAAKFNRSTVQDHQTKGDQPFQALVSRQLQIQPPSPVGANRFAPLRGRKVLVFSDSRQVAARLAPNLQMYSVRDSLRSLVTWGFRRLQACAPLQQRLNLEDIYLAALLASQRLSVRLRPELRPDENFGAEGIVESAVRNGALDSDQALMDLWMDMRNERPPVSLLDDLMKTVLDRFLGLEALAIASFMERGQLTPALQQLPNIPGIAETPEAKVALARVWLRCWRDKGFWLGYMPTDWWQRPRRSGTSVKGHKGNFKAMDRLLQSKDSRKIFKDRWLPQLLTLFTETMDTGVPRLAGRNLSLMLGGEWVRCQACKSVHRPIPGYNICIDCGATNVAPLDPVADPVFEARKGFYRHPIVEALEDPPVAPMALIAAEHTAQLNAPQNEDIFSKAEQHELLFQDVELSWGAIGRRATAIDVLSSTTTMEVGIDIGALSGVALRNMPPGRANYQQRAGRAGRRGNAVATVVAFGSADSHDEHYFQSSDEMICGPVVDPRLTLDNADIVKRHIQAFLLQRYHQERLPDIDPEEQPDLFSVLGTVADFCTDTAILNRSDFERWLNANSAQLRQRVASWIPVELNAEERDALLENLVSNCMQALNDALRGQGGTVAALATAVEEEVAAEDGEQSGVGAESDKLLDWLLYKGILPRYAFPTDVANFCVFDRDNSTRFRTVMRFAPSQGLPIALTQYAPGKQVWIAGKCYTSGAIYAQIHEELFTAWQDRRYYFECTECGFARTFRLNEIGSRDAQDCRACGGTGTFGPGHYWLRPPGFAHPIDAEEVTSPDDMPETSYATRAKLVMATPSDEARWHPVGERVRVLTNRTHLLVSNTGPDQEGYSYCTKCGRIEASTIHTPLLTQMRAHQKPYPADNDQQCASDRISKKIVLGTDFITDIALFSMRVAAPLKLRPGYDPTNVALRTVSEALAKAACQILEIEPGELMAEFRPALTIAGSNGLESEIFLYDTLPGGAGFSSQLTGHAEPLLRAALRILKECPEHCDASCYRCLRSFKNKFEHSLLDRHVGAALVEYLLTGELPSFDERRLAASTELLCHDLQRQQVEQWTIEPNARLTIPRAGEVIVPILITKQDGKRFAVGLSGPLTDGHPANPSLREIQANSRDIEVVPINELIVRGNLARATRMVQERVYGNQQSDAA